MDPQVTQLISFTSNWAPIRSGFIFVKPSVHSSLFKESKSDPEKGYHTQVDHHDNDLNYLVDDAERTIFHPSMHLYQVEVVVGLDH